MSFLTTYVKAVLDSAGKTSIMSFFGSLATAKMIVDGNMAHAHIIRSADGTLVGTDMFGNRYYENYDTASYTRKRFVVYADKFDYSATSVPPQWHGWLNYINDYAPTRHEFKKPIYEVDHYITRTGTEAAYAPKGSWNNPEKRNWKKYQAWQPESSS